jgi:epoxyqueuosine reductase
MSQGGKILEAALKAEALRLGFDRVGIAAPSPSEHSTFYRGWIEDGAHGQMTYLAHEDAMARRADLTGTLENVRSVIVVAHEYATDDPPGVPEDPSVGVIARYARGRDYHRVIAPRLRRLLAWLDEQLTEHVNGRAYADTGPILERELGVRAGLGWFGKNTMLIHPRRGSYFFLGVLLVDVALEPDPPFMKDHCGTCRACLDACPTGALLGRTKDGAPVMDARRCISYLTIEHRGPIPEELRPLIGNRVFGCDICQECCPFNKKFAGETAEPGYAARGPGKRPVGVAGVPGEDLSGERHPGTQAPSLIELLETALDPARWDAYSRGSAIRRAGRAGLARNVCVALGNWLAEVYEPTEEALEVLQRALEDGDPMVREHAAWGLEQARSKERPDGHQSSAPFKS